MWRTTLQVIGILGGIFAAVFLVAYLIQAGLLGLGRLILGY